MGFSLEKFTALHEAMLAAGMPSPYQDRLENWNSDRGRGRGHQVTTRVRCDEYFEIRDEALRAHATQVDPDGFWFAVPLSIQRQAWPTEDFELARSLVGMALPEDDLFTGVRESVCT